MSMGLFAPYNCDAYKLGHISQYPEGTNLVFSNFTARSNKYLEIPELYKDGKYVVAGLSRFIS
jgi:nicotinamide phosphoribosyltransferase